MSVERKYVCLTKPQIEYFEKVALRRDIPFSEAIRRALDNAMGRDDERLIRRLEKRSAEARERNPSE